MRLEAAKEGQRFRNVLIVIARRVGNRFRDNYERGAMNDAGDVGMKGENPRNGSGVADVAFMKKAPFRERMLARHERVDDDGSHPDILKGRAYGAANEASPTCDKNFHGNRVLCGNVSHLCGEVITVGARGQACTSAPVRTLDRRGSKRHTRPREEGT